MKSLILRYLRIFFSFIDLKEQLMIYRLKKEHKIISLLELKKKFEGKHVFSFATGGSLSNLKDNLSRLNNKNIFTFSRGIIYLYKDYGLMPNIWFVHNTDSIFMTIKEIKKYNLENSIDFSNTFILVPSNFSKSKPCNFSSKAFKEFRKLINHNATFVLYSENYEASNPENVPNNYLESIEPIEFINGSAVENTFLPWLSFIGVKTIFFSGVDHMDTGHFWDRKEYYQDINGKLLNFQEIQPNELIFECGRVARKKCEEKGIKVYRLEKTETILTDYPYIEFDEAYKIASDKIFPKDIFK